MEKLDLVIAIFGKHGTSEKVLLPVPKDSIREAMKMLENKYGGMWVYCEKLKGDGEMLKFDDGVEYLGFDSKVDRYCSFIEKF